MATLEIAHDVPLERERFFALGAALLTVTLWASAFVGIRSAGRDLSPGALALGRLVVASVALGALALVCTPSLRAPPTGPTFTRIPVAPLAHCTVRCPNSRTALR